MWKSTVPLLFIGIAMAGLLGWGYVQSPHRRQSRVVRICSSSLHRDALITMAQMRSEFSRSGLDVSITRETEPEACIQAIKEGRVDLAAVAMQPLVEALMRHERLVIISELLNTKQITTIAVDPAWRPASTTRVVIENIAEKTALRFFVESQNIALRDLTFRKVNSPEEALDLMARREAELAVFSDPKFVKKRQNRFSELGIALHSAPFFTQFEVLIGSVDFSSGHGDEVTDFLQALKSSQQFVREHKSQARNLVAKQGVPDLLDHVNPKIGLSSLLLAMIRQTQISLAPGASPLSEASAININQFLHPQALRRLDPHLVTYE